MADYNRARRARSNLAHSLNFKLRPSTATSKKVAADLNQIPAQLIEQVEVLTGGASAVYGADAIAGVVNFRLKRDFQGLDAKLQGGFFNDAVAATPSCCA